MQRLETTSRCSEWFEPLHEIAIEATGLDDFGDSHYRQGLKVLLSCLEGGCDLSDVGWYATKLKITHVLKRRLLAEQAFKTRPKALSHEIRRPLVITGLVRTGSTALHYLLARDPNRQCLPYWLAEYPQPKPPLDTWQTQPDFQASKRSLDMMYDAAPDLKAIHFMTAEGPEECGHLMAQTFTDDYWECGMSAPEYVQWYEGCDMEPTYRQHKKLLQYISAPDPQTPWLLKYPVHMKHLASFLKVYPDALVVWTHRDPAKVMSSYASLLCGFRFLNVNHVDKTQVALEQVEIWAAAAERAINIRRKQKPEQFYDLYFQDFVADPIAAVRRIYEYFDLKWNDECESALNAWQADNPRDKHGRHGHSVADIDLSHEQIRERFASYIDHFSVSSD